MDDTLLTSILIALVGVFALILMVAVAIVFNRSRNPRMLFLGSAFSVFFIKSIFVSLSLLYNLHPHEHLELYSSFFDLAIVILLFAPLLGRWGAKVD